MLYKLYINARHCLAELRRNEMVRTTERFGAWILNSRAGLVFGCIVLVLAGLVSFKSVFGEIELLSSRDFICAMSAPDGLEARCVEYVLKEGRK